MTPWDERQKSIHELWDRLADLEAAQVDEALDCLMEGICALVDGQNAEWFGMVRLDDAETGDPVNGWRPPVLRFLHTNDALLDMVRAQTEYMDRRFDNEAATKVIAQAGRFRAARLCDLAPGAWFESEVYRRHYRDCDREDVIYVAFPVNEDAESWFGVFRAAGKPRFTVEERDAVAYALRGLKWFHRQLLLSHGLLVAGAPLTQGERRVLQGLLGGRPEKQIAADLGQSPHTTHEHVTAIYRKFAVNNRPALLALWLGSTKTGAEERA